MEESVSAIVESLVAEVERMASLERLEHGVRIGEDEEASSSGEASEEPEAKRSRHEEFEPARKERPLNRRERRALLYAEMQEKQAALQIQEEPVVDKTHVAAKPPGFNQIYIDEQSFQHYRASFGYGATRDNNYVRFASLSPSGKYALAAAQDRYVRVYSVEENSEQINIEWKHNMGGLIYDTVWMKDIDVFATTSKDHPIHLWSARTSDLVGAYVGKDSADAVESAMCIGFVGSRIVAGFKKGFQFWNIERGGNSIDQMPYLNKNNGQGLTGRAMSIDAHPHIEDTFVTVGACDRVYVHSSHWFGAVTTMMGKSNGYTHVRYSADGSRIYASARKGNIHVFDVRKNEMCQVLRREMKTNHRSTFDIDLEKNLLYSGTSNGEVVVFDMGDPAETLEPIARLKMASTCVPSVSVVGNRMVACSGERIYPSTMLCDSDEENNDTLENCTLYPQNTFQIWNIV